MIDGYELKSVAGGFTGGLPPILAGGFTGGLPPILAGGFYFVIGGLPQYHCSEQRS
jgi:hypothetical protein